MKCPHCLTAFHDNVEVMALGGDSHAQFDALRRLCPECQKLIIHLRRRPLGRGRGPGGVALPATGGAVFMCYPKATSRAVVSSEVPEQYTVDYKEAYITLPDSPKASAALSRRCLQHLLEEEVGVKKDNLYNEIQEVLDAGKMPTHILNSLDAVRNIGNFAAHPIKSTSSGEIIEVEEGEAEWNLDVLESLFDYLFTQPAETRKKKDALNKRLRDAGKPEMK